MVFSIAISTPVWAQSPRAGGPSPSDEPGSRIAAELALTGNLARGLVDRELISTRGIFQVWKGPLGFYIAGGKLALVHDLIVIPAFAHPITDYRILFYGAIDAPIAKGFSVRVQADATREGKIVAGTKHDDLVVTFGLAYRNEWSAAKPAPPPP